jgi:hypothetical protein
MAERIDVILRTQNHKRKMFLTGLIRFIRHDIRIGSKTSIFLPGILDPFRESCLFVGEFYNRILQGPLANFEYAF